MDSKRRRRKVLRIAGFITSVLAARFCSNAMPAVQALEPKHFESLRAGAALIINKDIPTTNLDSSVTLAIGITLDGSEEAEDESEESNLVMANVKNTLNVREEPTTDSKKVGYLYSDCGGEILERSEGWTKIKSGNLEGWASDEYLLFGKEAQELADSVGITVITISADSLRVRKGPSTDDGVYGLIAKGEKYEVVSEENGWVCIDYDGYDGYLSADYTTSEFIIDYGETLEEVKIREEEERKAKLRANYGKYAADASDEMLLAALIHCEAAGESPEGKLAVGAVVMNRVRSGAYPNTILGVIYASGQFTPVGNGKVDTLLSTGKINPGCIEAARQALNGDTNVGPATHFRRAGNHPGDVIGNHVFW